MTRWMISLSSFQTRPSSSLFSSLCFASPSSSPQDPSWIAAVMLQPYPPPPSSFSSSLLSNFGSRLLLLDGSGSAPSALFPSSQSCCSAGAAALPPFTLPGSTDPLPASLTIEKLRCRARDGKEEAGAGGEDLKETFSPVVLVTPVSSWRMGTRRRGGGGRERRMVSHGLLEGLSEGFAHVVSSDKENVNVWMHQV